MQQNQEQATRVQLSQNQVQITHLSSVASFSSLRFLLASLADESPEVLVVREDESVLLLDLVGVVSTSSSNFIFLLAFTGISSSSMADLCLELLLVSDDLFLVELP